MSFLPRGRADQPRGGDSTGGGDELGAIRRYPTDQNRGAMARNQKNSFCICLYDQSISNPQSISVLFDPFDDLHLMMFFLVLMVMEQHKIS